MFRLKPKQTTTSGIGDCHARVRNERKQTNDEGGCICRDGQSEPDAALHNNNNNNNTGSANV